MEVVIKLNILFVGVELDKFIKEGGLGDYMFDLSTNLAKIENINVSVIIPNFKNIDNANFTEIGEYFISCEEDLPNNYLSYKILHKKQYGIDIYLVDNDFYYCTDAIYNVNDFLKFSFFNRAVYDFIQHNDFDLDIVHLNDWHCGLLSKLMHNQDKIKTVLTVHNASHQGYMENISDTELKIFNVYYGDDYNLSDINFLKMGMENCDGLLTVSNSYISEHMIPTMQNLNVEHSIDGIINGMNPDIYPREYSSFDDFLDFKRNVKLSVQKEYGLEINADIPLFISVGRLFIQKGIDLIIDVIDDITSDAQFIILGTGDECFENEILEKSNSNENLVALIEFNSDVAMKLYQAGDIFLMPSLFEPCGIAQLIAMYYGTVPIVHNVGGLKDTVVNYDFERCCGFKYDMQESSEFLKMINISKECYKKSDYWNKLVKNALNHPYIWSNQVKSYVDYYNNII